METFNSDIETINIFGDNRLESVTKTRAASRGILMSGDSILLTHENNGQYFIPGGGTEDEDGGSPEKCCARELAEETGILVEPKLCFLTLNEYYGEWKFISRYYICEYSGRAERKLTEREKEAGVEPVWVSLREALNIFSEYMLYADTDEMRRGAYLREFTALKYFSCSRGLTELARPCFFSEFAEVRYLPRYNVALVVWKSFCRYRNYRAPLEYALDIIKRYGCDYAADTRSGFENIPDDTRWVAEYFMPKAAEYGCRTIYFIIDSGNSLKEELEGQQSDSEDIMRFEYIYDISELENK